MGRLCGESVRGRRIRRTHRATTKEESLGTFIPPKDLKTLNIIIIENKLLLTFQKKTETMNLIQRFI